MRFEEDTPSARNVKFRTAQARDARSIADLHALSWRTHYRGALSDEFLSGDIVANRLELWNERLALPSTTQFVYVAEKTRA